jgi:hypothetical protein
MTPPRLVEFACPSCMTAHWEIDSDYRGAELLGKKELSYSEREYSCPACKGRYKGWRILQKSPPAFLLKPHSPYPWKWREFNYWAKVLREHFPDHPLAARLGGGSVPSHRVLQAFLGNVMLNGRYYLGGIRRRVRQWLGTGS